MNDQLEQQTNSAHNTTAGDSRPLRVGIIVGSTRPGRNAVAVADWVHDLAARREDAVYDIVDIADYSLPLLDEPIPAIVGEYAHPHTRRWATAIDAFDAFVFLVPEYNHSMPAALKNAIDFLFAEWNDKAAGFVSYGGDGGIRAAEHLRLVMAEVKVAGVRQSVMLTLADDFENYSTFTPASRHELTLATMLDELSAWAGALRHVRQPSASASAVLV